MGFHYKNFIAVVIVCGAAFGGFFSFVYSAEQAKSEVKNEEGATVPEKQYNEEDIARIREAIMAVQRKLLADEKKRLAVAEGDTKKKRIMPLAVPKVSVAAIPSAPVVSFTPVVPAPTVATALISSPSQTAQPVKTVKPTQPRTTVS